MGGAWCTLTTTATLTRAYEVSGVAKKAIIKNKIIEMLLIVFICVCIMSNWIRNVSLLRCKFKQLHVGKCYTTLEICCIIHTYSGE